MAAVKAQQTEALVGKFIARRASFYEAIVRNDPSQSKFQRGWANRLAALSNATQRSFA